MTRWLTLSCCVLLLSCTGTSGPPPEDDTPAPTDGNVRLVYAAPSEAMLSDAVADSIEMSWSVLQNKLLAPRIGRVFRRAGGLERLVADLDDLGLGSRPGNDIFRVYYEGGEGLEECGFGQLGGRVAVFYIRGSMGGRDCVGTGGWGKHQRLQPEDERFQFVTYPEAAAAHGLFHVLGAVPDAAPNFCGEHHVCDDGADLMNPWTLAYPFNIDVDGADYRDILLDSPYLEPAP